MWALHADISRNDMSLLPQALRCSQAPEWGAQAVPSLGTQPFVVPGVPGVSAKPYKRTILSCRFFRFPPSLTPCLSSPSGPGLGGVPLRLTSGAEVGRLCPGQVSSAMTWSRERKSDPGVWASYCGWSPVSSSCGTGTSRWKIGKGL